ncbi:hypothetical protein BDV96DRAFT_613052 [Lophiotrema nucula]|uniref:Mid2 domain-containing protein n=1 Tax=Lophiotrema nucula TaxID=690887 RepID=A0A6A5Z9K8_9PLEO|nr:hypothetical protein BDV96DRAFT_613052 [Lophiotrema nucula]
MTRRLLFGCARAATLAAVVRFAIADDAKCYYPNGVEAPEKPCSSDSGGSACCPDKWTCLDNGLCQYEVNNLWGAYSCTDQSWKSEKCPSNICTYNMQRPGGESIKQCSNHDNQWCCNADDQNVHCCDEWPSARPFYDLQQGTVYATIGGDEAASAPNVASVTMLASGSASGNAASSTPPASSTPAASSNTPAASSKGASSKASSAQGSSKTPDPFTSVQTSVSSGTAGVQTIVFTSVVTPAASTGTTTPPSSSSSSKSHLGLIVGCAVGIPLALALIGILIWLLRKRSQNRKNPYNDPSDAAYGTGDSPTLNGSSDFAGGAKLTKPQAYGHTADPHPGVAELPSTGVGPERPISTIKGKAELASGGGFAAGAIPHGPNQVGIGGGTGHTPASSWGSAPPGYSPGMNQQAFQPVEADGTPVLGHTAANTTDGGRYIPYRPPPQQQQQHLQNVPEMAELGTVKTPPA